MKLGDVMTRGALTCCPNDSLNLAAQLMWEHDCGSLPVVDADGKAIAMITDRDICMAAYTQGQPLWAIPVSSAASRELFQLREGDGLESAEALMQKHQIRRVPVVDANGRPVGIVSMNDLARHSHRTGHRQNGLNPEAIIRTLAAVCQPAPVQANAAE